MRYIPHTKDDIRHLLETIGAPSVDALFAAVPEHLRVEGRLDLPAALSEPELLRMAGELARRNRDAGAALSFLGAGTYHHHIPPAIDELTRRSEFYTAYTPYQAELAQGTLQAVFEFQTLVCQLLGMEVANASMYDGATACAEAVLMADRVARKRHRVLMSAAVHPEYREVTKSYLSARADDLEEIPHDAVGLTDLASLGTQLADDVAAVVVQYPNFFGGIEPLAAIARLAHEAGALLIVTFTEALAFGLLQPPGAFGADIVAGEGQSLGVSMSFGGPHVGLFATRDKNVRAMPGRLVGQSVDTEGRRAFVLTMSTREQHIRREKATSNICTNEGLCALAATIYMALLGPVGLRKLATLNHRNAERAKKAIAALPGYALRFPQSPTFNEFVVTTPRPAAEIVDALVAQDIAPGLALGRLIPGMDDALLVTVTEMHGPSDIDRLAAALAAV